MSTPRENVLRTLRRQGFEWVPVEMGFCPSQVEAFRRRFGHEDYRSYFQIPFRDTDLELRTTYQNPRDLYEQETLPDDVSFNAYGIANSRQPGCYHMTHMHHPLAGEVSLSRIKDYPLPIIVEPSIGRVKSDIQRFHEQGLASFGGLATLWETAWALRSMEDLMADMMADDERAVVLFDRITDHAIMRTRHYVQGGADIIGTGDDVGMQNTTMMSPELWRKWIKPRLARLISSARDINPDVLVWYHSDGYIIPFLEDLIEIGVDILNPVQPECMNFEEVYRLADGRLSFWGTIGTQKTLPFGTPAEVKREVFSRLEVCGKNGGIVIAPTHVVEPEVPWENLVAMAEAAAEFNKRKTE